MTEGHLGNGTKMEPHPSLSTVRGLMAEFAYRTGLARTDSLPRRYLWTDAFAVCNYLHLFCLTGEEQFRDLALRLVNQVHHVLGRHRQGDSRSGWISGLGESDGERHPTIGGLRIGKPMNERLPDEPYDEQMEWERDGQYFHYLTKWMHALDRTGRNTGKPIYHVWAMELAQTAYARFTYGSPSGGRRRMYWKMSIDLSTPLVPSMGQHDPLEGLATYCQLQDIAGGRDIGLDSPDLSAEIAGLENMCEVGNWSTDDPLGAGGLLTDACRIVQLAAKGAFPTGDLLEKTLDAAMFGLEAFSARSPFRFPAEFRLAFRELGLSIGLKGFQKLRGVIHKNPALFGQNIALHRRIDRLERFMPLAEKIDAFWAEAKNRQAETWLTHHDINTVMLATSLAPEEFLAA
jgi:hypothetical protein